MKLNYEEFIEKVNFREHFRVYQMNMDGLIYESYYTTHSPYFFDKEHEEKREYFLGTHPSIISKPPADHV